MSDHSSITLAIPCYNAAVFIETVLQSITRQTRPPEEIIVVDDGSTDESPNIIKQFTQVRLIRHVQNRGIAAARNTAWQNARGDVVVFIDADSLADTRLLERLARCYNDKNIAGAGGRGLEVIQETRYDRWRKEVLYQGTTDGAKRFYTKDGAQIIDHGFTFYLACAHRIEDGFSKNSAVLTLYSESAGKIWIFVFGLERGACGLCMNPELLFCIYVPTIRSPSNK
jgi:glycosyltransferase involved in cell wall biosynthesis